MGSIHAHKSGCYMLIFLKMDQKWLQVFIIFQQEILGKGRGSAHFLVGFQIFRSQGLSGIFRLMSVESQLWLGFTEVPLRPWKVPPAIHEQKDMDQKHEQQKHEQNEVNKQIEKTCSLWKKNQPWIKPIWMPETIPSKVLILNGFDVPGRSDSMISAPGPKLKV